MKRAKYIAIAGDIIFILWVLYNGIDEGFRSIMSIQGIVPIGLMLLLLLNLIILWKQK
jgi:hypothetical protein